MGRVDHDALAALDAGVDPDMRHTRGTASEEDEVTGLERLAGRHERPRVVLCLRGAREADPGGTVGGLGEPRAVEADPRGLPAPDT